MLELAYKTRRGGWVHRRDMTPAEIVAKLPTIKNEAVVRKDDQVVGGVQNHAGYVDDRRVKWVWWYDAEALK